MSGIEATIIRDVENAYNGCFRVGIGMTDYEWHEDEHFIWLCSYQPVPFFNGILVSRGNRAVYEKRVPELLAYFRERNLPALWRVTTQSENREDLIEVLLKHGVKLDEMMTVAYAPLSIVDANDPALSRLVIHRVDNEADLMKWFVPFGEAFGIEGALANWFVSYFRQTGFGERSSFPSFYGTVDGQPAACFSIFKQDAVAGAVFNLGVANAFRGKGFGRSITLHAAHTAKAMGHQFVGQFATEQGFPLYQKLGARSLGEYGFYRM